MEYKKPNVVAEIGCNHKGDFDIAKQMVMVAAVFCKANIVKFQKRYPKELLTNKQYNDPHPNQLHAYGKTYGEHREYLEFSIDQHRELQSYCNDYGIEYSSSVWDLRSAKEVCSLSPTTIKVPSACNTNDVLLNYLCENFKGEIHVSLGMTKRSEEERLINLLVKNGRIGDVVLYSCTSGYPVPFESICLLEIDRLKSDYGSIVKSIGYSGHHLGIAIDISAYTLGAAWIERHFTLDRTWKGTDHAASLEPDGLRRLIRDLLATHNALSRKAEEILPIEIAQRQKLKIQNVSQRMDLDYHKRDQGS
jgi:sialic acid synthase